MEKWAWCRKRKLSKIQFYIFKGPPNIFWGSKYFFIEMSNFQNAISQKGLIEKFWFQWEMVTLTCLQHIPLTKLPRLFSSHDCPSRQVWHAHMFRSMNHVKLCVCGIISHLVYILSSSRSGSQVQVKVLVKVQCPVHGLGPGLNSGAQNSVSNSQKKGPGETL